MVCCCVPYCKSRAGKTPGVSFHQFPVDQELCSKWQRNISRQNLVINDKSPSTVVCSRHFCQIDYAPDCRIRKLLPGAVPTVFEDYPAYLAPSAKKPRKEPVVRQSLPPRKPTKRKAEPEELPADLDAPESFDKPSANVSTQITNNDAQRASQDRSGLAYPRPEFLALLNGIVTFFEKIAKHLPRTHVLEVLQLLVEPHLDVPLQNCPDSVDNSHGRRSASMIADKFFRILLVNHSTRVTDDNEKRMNYTHKPSRKHFRL
ncbi:hypothetical protein HPB48_001563 [Haemaphysalis longicornis]|uniref:THAP-type domain-containing protein n=1 Tax=Haemaphysalis longicornis TaxID=44386 RepID=A0A9J6FE77_HAELO|nr:hypothetical protein HPB48_001563 [Haemaphysalis longicornis]